MARDYKRDIDTNLRAISLLVLNLTRSLAQLERDVKKLKVVKVPVKPMPVHEKPGPTAAQLKVKSGWPAYIGKLVRDVANLKYWRIYSNVYKDGRVRVKLYGVNLSSGISLDGAAHVIASVLASRGRVGSSVRCHDGHGPFSAPSITIVLSAQQAAKPVPKWV